MNETIKQRCRAFTLIEILVVVAIILILMGISLKMMSTVNSKTGVAKTLYVLEQTRNALESYYSTVGAYPNTLDIRYDRCTDDRSKWAFDASSSIKEIKGLTYYLGYEPNARAASWRKFVINVSPAVIVPLKDHTNSPAIKVGFDPIISTNKVNSILDAWDQEIIYVPNANSDGYVLSSKGPDGVAGTVDDIGITKNE